MAATKKRTEYHTQKPAEKKRKKLELENAIVLVMKKKSLCISLDLYTKCHCIVCMFTKKKEEEKESKEHFTEMSFDACTAFTSSSLQ